jgi:hypothetical protein
MELTIEPLTTSTLTNLEAGQLIRRHLSDWGALDATLKTNAPLNKYFQALTAKVEVYEKAINQVRKNEETEKIEKADAARDKANTAFSFGLKLYAVSDVDEEIEASRSLGILLGSYKNLAKLNYEAETLALDKLTSELNAPAYKSKVDALNMSRYVTRMIDTNTAFKNLFSGRMVKTATTETYNLKTIRLEMQATYGEMCDYVLAMAKALDTPLFEATLNLINTGRKYYADMVARRATKKTEPEKPAE